MKKLSPIEKRFSLSLQEQKLINRARIILADKFLKQKYNLNPYKTVEKFIEEKPIYEKYKKILMYYAEHKDLYSLGYKVIRNNKTKLWDLDYKI